MLREETYVATTRRGGVDANDSIMINSSENLENH